MSTFNRSTVTSVFQNEAQAQQAMADLQNAGFSTDQIRYSVHRGGSGILDSLLGLGLGNDEANYYNSEFMAGRTVVTVNTDDHQQEAYDVLHRYDVYDWNSRSDQAANYAGSSANAYTQTSRNRYPKLTRLWTGHKRCSVPASLITAWSPKSDMISTGVNSHVTRGTPRSYANAARLQAAL